MYRVWLLGTEKLFTDVESIEDFEMRKRILEELGRSIESRYVPRFRRLLEDVLREGEIDVTDWTVEAVQVALEFARAKRIHLKMTVGRRQIIIGTPPKTDILTERFAASILSGEWDL